jgi:hypothetical protein
LPLAKQIGAPEISHGEDDLCFFLKHGFTISLAIDAEKFRRRDPQFALWRGAKLFSN